MLRRVNVRHFRTLAIVVLLVAWGSAALGHPHQNKTSDSKGNSEPPKPHVSNFNRVINKATGNNAYEDYVLATDVVMEPKVQAAGHAAMKQPPEPTPLGAKRAWVAAGKRALELVRRGNQKPIFDPRDTITPATLLPEFAGFKTIAKLFAAEARVRLADGDSAGGTQSIVDCLSFADRIGHYLFIGSLVDIACTSIILAEVEVDLGRLSQKDALKLAASADSLLQQPTAVIDGLRSEAKTIDLSIEFGFSEILKNAGQTGGEAEPQAYQQIRGMSDSQRQDLKNQVSLGARQALGQVISRLEGDEKDWIGYKDQEPNSDDTVNTLINLVRPVYGPSLEAAAKSRTQLRLLRLHGAIIAFFWEHHRLPKDLGELDSKAITEDPILGKPFHYEKAGDDGYKLWSDGWGNLGKIELKYRRVPGAGGDEGPAVP